MSLTATLSLASRSLDLFSLGIQVAGHNIANASTPGYVRDQLQIETSAPYQMGPLSIGTGATAVGIRQQWDAYLEERIYAAHADAEAALLRKHAWQDIEQIMQDLQGQGVQQRLTDLLAAVHNLTLDPQQSGLRTQLIQQGQALARDVQLIRSRLEDSRRSYSQQIEGLLNETNALLRSIRDLNDQIVRLESNGLAQNDAGPLRVQRLNALQRLAEIVPIRVVENAAGAVDIYTGNDYLLLGGTLQQLTTAGLADDQGQSKVVIQLSQTKSELQPSAGKLGGWLESRDRILSTFIEQFDQFVQQFVWEWNRVYSQGEGISGYTRITSQRAVDDGSIPLAQAGLPGQLQSGSVTVKLRNLNTGLTTSHRIVITAAGHSSDTTLTDLQTQLDAVDHLSAIITSDGRLQLQTDDGYELRFGEDTSGVWAALGLNVFFVGDTSSDVEVLPALITHPEWVATGRGGGYADQTNLLEIAQILDRPLHLPDRRSLKEWYQQIVGQVAQGGAAETSLATGFENFRQSLLAQREQNSGVNLDEEAIRVMQFQHNYKAAARIISTIDQLLDVLLNI
ncbi:MAG: flagellar hook-associated protein 1 [Planctomycetaceae bacterium]|nr:MAG: flagellar hook-associated protein 1 [Planctomycetaceae bacterium]